jgi:AcrR family transcriptional regulator
MYARSYVLFDGDTVNLNSYDRTYNYLEMTEAAIKEQKPDGRRLRGDRNRAAILDQSVRIAGVEGLDGLTFGRVALAAAVPKSTLAALFKDREELQLQTLRYGAEAFADALRRRLRSRSGSLGQLRALCDAWFELLEEDQFPGGCLVTAVSAEYRARPGAIQQLVAEYLEAWQRTLFDAAQEAQKAGGLAPDVDLKQLTFEILAFQGAAHVNAADRRRAGRAIDTLLDRVQRKVSRRA